MFDLLQFFHEVLWYLLVSLASIETMSVGPAAVTMDFDPIASTGSSCLLYIFFQLPTQSTASVIMMHAEVTDSGERTAGGKLWDKMQ
jgi:hypothetical protein